MPKILVTADLHLDLWKRTDRDPLTDAMWHGPDAVIVAGDLSNSPQRKWPRHLKRLVDRVGAGRVFILPGNHDYYDLRLGDDACLGALCTDAGAELAQKRVLVFGEWRFLCATLWTDLTLGGAAMRGTDYRRIVNPDGGPLCPESVRAIHDDHLQWLEHTLAQPWQGKTAVITHHAPHPVLLSDHAPALFASDLTGVMERHAPDLWLFGHTHHPVETRIGTTLIRNISLGGPNDIADNAIHGRLSRGLIVTDA